MMWAGVTSVLIYVAAVAWIIRRRTELVPLLLFFFIGFGWRLSSVAYVDAVGPTFSVELFREIGGGASSLVMVSCILLFFASILFVFRPSQLQRLSNIPVGGEIGPQRSKLLHAAVTRFIIIGYCLFLVALMADLLRGGVIPLFAGIERYIFSNELAGPFHGMLVKYGLHISLMLGLFFAYGELIAGKPDRRFLMLLGLTFFYLLLVGNRFSAFFSYGTWFATGWTIVSIRNRKRRTPSAPRENDPVMLKPISAAGRIRRRIGIAVIVLGTMGMMSYGIYRSLTFTRDLVGTEALENLVHRVFVIQGELFTATYERVFEKGRYDPSDAFDKIFVHPVWDPDRNTTIPYLMELEIGDRIYPILEIGSTYTGGYPEILFELLGPVFGFAGVVVAGLILGLMYRAMFRAAIEQRYIKAALIFWIAYLVLMFHAGGMLNTFGNWKFVVKVSFVLFWLLYEFGRVRPSSAPQAA
jgi:hypothetical protein